ncbi:multiple epidermal growth factor-like domains protein 11 isoform X2 [Equus przewalskii]|uniref:Multiple epidermal growth factor-like domains protein 11 isoform X2 n=1 Tax=Equus przewalskii TaxID=9798 RepID=A0ABM4L989_EQUPR
MGAQHSAGSPPDHWEPTRLPGLFPSIPLTSAGASVPARCPPGTWSEEGNQTPEGCQDCYGGRLCSGSHPSIWPAPGHPGISCTEGTVSATTMEGVSGRSCPPGPFSPLGMAEPTPCPPGSYTSSTRTTKCHICPSSRYCVPGLRPQLCPRGFYCPEGTGLNWQPCPPGTYSPVPGLGSLPGCRVCDGGRFCPRASATEAGGQCWEGFFCSRGSTRPNPEAGTEEGAGPCPQGHYCPRGSAVPQPCPPGTFGSCAKLSSEDSCSPCPPGHYCSSAGLASPSGLCSTGFFCLSGALVPNGSLGDQAGGPCPTGTLVAGLRGAGEVGNEQTPRLPPRQGPRAIRRLPAVPWALQELSLGWGRSEHQRVGLLVALTCGPAFLSGHFCPPGTAVPRPCPAGTHNGLAARGHCEPCPEG